MSLQLSYRKQGQGAIARSTAGLALVGMAAFGCGSLASAIRVDWWERILLEVPFFEFLISSGELISFCLFLFLVLAIYLFVVNHPVCADFLIETEAELRKVSWPEGDEAVNAAIVVMITVILIAALLAAFDTIFIRFMRLIGVLPN